jgi:hypothetical protein
MSEAFPRKPDSARIIHFIKDLPNRLRLSGAKEYWPRYLFHTTGIHNAVAILECGEFRSRDVLLDEGSDITDAADPGIIGQTESEYTNSVRFYFRPRTPTHYRTEGFKPRSSGVHMPIPIVFCVDAEDVMTRLNTVFTNGNAGTAAHRAGGDADFLDQIPFDIVYFDYSDGQMPFSQDTMTFHRNAEVCIPTKLSLTGLDWRAYARSEAELDTFMDLIKSKLPGIVAQNSGRIRLNSQTANYRSLFHRHRWYVDRVHVNLNIISVEFHQGKGPQPTFDIRMSIHFFDTSSPVAEARRDNTAGIWKVATPDACRHHRFGITITLDGVVAYQNHFPSLETSIFGDP